MEKDKAKEKEDKERELSFSPLLFKLSFINERKRINPFDTFYFGFLNLIPPFNKRS